MYDDKSLETLEYHRSILLDEVRTESFLLAILKTFKPGVRVSNVPPLKTPSWNQVYFPIREQIPLRVGDLLNVEIRSFQNAENWEWKITTNGSKQGQASTVQAVIF